MTEKGDTKSSARVLAALKKAERAFNTWNAICDTIDDIYSRDDDRINSWFVSPGQGDWVDPEYDLFWSSMEIMKPAIYAKPPEPVVSPQFKDKRKLQSTTAELLERTVKSSFDRGGIDEVMIGVRDDLIFYNRGQIWLTYETDEKGGGQRVCSEHLDRKDFLHSPARKWSEVPLVARRAWMWPKELRKRFYKTSKDAYKDAKRSTGEGDDKENKGKVGVWEVWHREDNKVYWVAEGVSVLLDSGEPHLKLRGFFPCPRPAYGTLKPRTLEPRPDYLRYAAHFGKINSLTKRIYDLLDTVRMKGLIPSGGEVGDAVEQALKDDDNSSLLIPVPAAALMQNGGDFVQWMPLEQVAAAIKGLIEARRELFGDYDRLSGISDIMRGETEADETLGAQRLKSQYGSVRVKEKCAEIQRIARDVTQIAAEIMAENFSKDTLLEMSQMVIPTKAQIQARLKEIEDSAKEEINGLIEKGKQAAEQAQQSGQQVDPNQAKQQFEQAKQQIIGKYSQMIQTTSDEVPIEDVMKLLRDDKARGFAFEIATDSTIMTDEMQEKASRNEFLTVFSGATQGLIGLAGLGEPAAKLAGGMLKFVLQPYRVGRELDALIDDFIDAAPQMAQAAKGDQGSGEAEKAIAEANQKLAEAEMEKAKASIMKVQADAAYDQAENQRKMMELQAKSEKDRNEMAVKVADAQSKSTQAADQSQLMAAQIDKLRADTAKILNSIGLDERKQQLSEYQAASDTQFKATDQAMNAQNSDREAMSADREAERAERGEDRADRQQAFGEQQGARSDDRADRQQDLAEKQAQMERADG